MDELERRRLLYVATTRAQDHLVVSLHRKDSGSTNAMILAAAGAATAGGAVAFQPPDDSAVATPASPVSPTDLPDWADWLATIESVRATSRRSAAVSASGLEGTEPAAALHLDTDPPPGAAKGARDVELPPWSKGRYGSAIGRAVHGVLQVIDLATGTGLDQAVASQSVAEGVVDHADVVRALVQSALDSDLIRRAAARDHWRESYVGMVQTDGTVLEGFVDLIFREEDGSLVIVDYKTDAIPADAVSTRTSYYGPQVRAYERIVTTATSSPATARLLFLNPAGMTA
jgi:ATP-dependent exoDNAse (exonuclease V) beta subunit